MKSKRRLVEAVIVCALLCLVSPLYAVTPWLHVEGNKIVDPANNVVVLRGIALIDLGFLQDWQGGAINMINRLTNINDPQGSSPGWYPRVIRINVTPPDSVSGWPHPFNPSNTDLYDLLRTVVDYCKTKDMYAIIDWHYIANTYDHVASTSEFWAYMAPRFANDSHVMFELFNEPMNNGSWPSVKADMQTWINIVRTYAPNNLILVGGPNWCQSIGPMASDPLTGDNLVAVSHIYPGHWRGGAYYQNEITTCAAVYPIMMTEWGFSQSGSPDPQDLLNGTITGYGQPLMDFRESYQIGNTAWVASYDWGPPMFWTNWTLRIGEGEMGGFTKDTLYLKRNDDQPQNGDSTAPAAPTGLAATVTDITVSLSWDDNSESDFYIYNIYRSTTSGGPYSKINTQFLRTPNYTDYNTVDYTTYYYVVKAIDTSFNASGYSSQISAYTTTDTTSPAAPTGLTATAGSGSNSLNWDDNSDYDIAGYNVYRSTISGGPYTKINISLASSSNYTDTNAVNLVTYYYVVTAVDTASNESYSSNQASATATDTSPPAKPTGLTGAIVGQTISLNWNDNIESDLAGYNIYRGTSSGGPYNILNGLTLLTSSDYIDTSATAGTRYYYVVRAIDLNMNTSSNSDQFSITLPDTTPPAAPTGLTATAGSGAVSLDWNDNIESDMNGYNVYRGTTSGGPYAKINSSLVKTSNYNDSSIISGTTYYYVVRAMDKFNNESANSNQVSATPVDTTPPAAPTGVAATAGIGSVSLDWNNNAESDLAGYYVYRSPTSGGTYTQLNGTPLSSSNYTDNSVTNGTTYYYVVTAVDNSSNESDNSNETFATPYADTTPPAAPTGLSAAAGNHSVSLDWNNNGEGDLAGYNIYRSTTSGSGYSKLNGTILSTSDYIDSSASNGVTYYYIVRAADIYSNESANSSEVSATPSPTTIYTFTGINTANTNYNAFACDVDVFPFAGNSGNRNSQVEASDIQYVNISTDNTTEWTTVDPGLNDEVLLWLEMKINEAPAAISRIDLTFDGYTSGSLAATYRIFVLTAGADWTQTASWTQVGTDQSISSGAYATMTRSITSNFSNYIDGTGKITWAVYETTSSESMHVNYLEMTVAGIATDTTPPAAPAGLSATDGIGTILLDWNDNGEGDLDGYNVYRSITSGSGYAKQNSSLLTSSNYNDSNVSNGTTYYYVVTAADTNSNESVYSSEAYATANNPAATGTGAILCEWWSGITGTAVSDLTSNANYPDNSTGRELLTKLEGPINWADDYGTRIRGFLIPPADGNYTFWIASDDASELWLSTNEQPGNASKIAYVSSWTNSREWNKEANQQSAQRALLANHMYYIEVLQKEDAGNDNIAVAWQGPGISQQVIDGLYLSPCCLDYRDFANLAEQWNRSDCNAGNNWCSGEDRDRDGNVQTDDLKTFAEEWLTGL